MVLGIKKEYCGVLLGTTGYWVVLGCTGGHWLVLRVLEGSGGTVWYQTVLWRTIGYRATGSYRGVLGRIRGYCGFLGSKRRYCGVMWGSLGYCSILLGTAG